LSLELGRIPQAAFEQVDSEQRVAERERASSAWAQRHQVGVVAAQQVTGLRRFALTQKEIGEVGMCFGGDSGAGTTRHPDRLAQLRRG
jgi:hypothetical protein